EDLIGGDDREVHGHHLDDRAKSQHRHADCRADHSRFRDRRIDHALRTVLLQHAGGDAERPFVDADVLTHDEDARIAIHLFHHRGANRVAVTHLAHRTVSSATGRGPCSATTSWNSSPPSGSGLSSANFTAAATRSAASSSKLWIVSSFRPHISCRRFFRIRIGSRCLCCSTSSFERYGWRMSAAPCPEKRYVIASMQ